LKKEGVCGRFRHSIDNNSFFHQLCHFLNENIATKTMRVTVDTIIAYVVSLVKKGFSAGSGVDVGVGGSDGDWVGESVSVGVGVEVAVLEGDVVGDGGGLNFNLWVWVWVWD
jgi:hypothetical protein